MSLENLKEKSKNFNYSEEHKVKREEGRNSFISKFPKGKIEDLSIDEYVQGTDENSFCYWLEFKNILFGIGGGNASKFGVYKAKDGLYYTSFGKNKKELSTAQLDGYFKNLKAGILQTLNYAENDEIEKIKELNIPVWKMVLQKILSIYYPDKFLTIGAGEVLIDCARDISLEGIDLNLDNSIQINYECKKKLSSLPEFKEWHYDKLGSFIWEVYSEKSKRDYFILGSKYGEKNNQDIFPMMLKEEVISVKFASAFNLKDYYLKNQKEITKYLKEMGEPPKSYNALKYFLNIKVGDHVAIKADGSPKGNKGFLSIVGIAEVIEKDGEIYRYDPNGLGHLLNVKFIAAPVYEELELGGYGRTIQKISKLDHRDLIFKNDYELLDKPSILNEEESVYEKRKIEMNFPLNTILYGPPGTGKTYNTILRAAEIIESRQIDSYDDALKIFKTKLHDQIEFITFHQNYSYEDFIQGLRPDIREENEQLKFKKSDGVFKVIADRALLNLKESKKPLEEINQSKAFDEALENLKDQVLESTKPVKINETAYFTAAEDDAFRYSGDNWTLNDKGFNGFRMKYSDLQRFFEEDIKERKEVKNLTNISGLAKQHATYFIKAYELVKSLMPRVSKAPERIEEKNYVIIIDEINRANISRVFGELITLIEPDKRSHGTIPLEVRLPSGDPFVVPSNLYIIGTMNTADKSIALLDIALRRRFEFEPMYPKYVQDGLDVKDEEILKSINQSIISEKGHDFQIGHSYFMSSNEEPYELKRRINVKVIPLLLEYFMNDSKTVAQIITKALIETNFKIDENSWPLKITDLND